MRNSSLTLIFLLSSLEVAFPTPTPNDDYLVLHLAPHPPHPRDCPPPHFVHTRHDDGSIESVNADAWPALGSDGDDARKVLKSKVAKKSPQSSVKKVIRKKRPSTTPDNDSGDAGNDNDDDDDGDDDDGDDDDGDDVGENNDDENDDDDDVGENNDDENDDDKNDNGNDNERKEEGGRKEASHSEKVTKSKAKAKSAKSSHRAAEKGANRTVRPDKDDDHSGEKGEDNQVKYQTINK